MIETENYLEIIKYRGTRRFFAALGKMKDKWFALIAPVITLDLNTTRDSCVYLSSKDRLFYSPYVDISANIHFKLNENDNTYYHLITLKEKENFDIVIATLESVYGAE